MTQMLSSNKLNRLSSVYLDCLSRYKSVFILYSVLLAVAGPVFLGAEVLDYLSSERRYFHGLSTEVLFHFAALALSCLLPLLLFSYINSRQAVDVYHAMPVTRDKLYWGNVLGGATILMAPYLALGIPCGIICELLNGSSNDGMLARVLWIGLGMLGLYSTMVFIMVNCGTLFESIIYFGITQLAYPLLILTVTQSLSQFTFGWEESIDSGLPGFLAAFAPGYLLVDVVFGNGTTDWRVVIQLAATITAALFLGMILYRRRRSESAGSAFAFKPLFYVGAMMVSVTAGVGCSLIFEDYGGLMIVISGIVGVLCYFILDTIRNRGLSGVRETALVSLGGVVAVGMFYGLALLTGTFGYEDHVPMAAGVKSVAVQWRAGSETYLSNSFAMTDDANIDRAIAVHKAITDNKKAIHRSGFEVNLTEPNDSITGDHTRYGFDNGSGNGWEYGFGNVTLKYTMIDGRTVSRRYYNIPLTLTQPLYEMAGSGDYRDLQWIGLKEAAESGRMYEADLWNFSLDRADGWFGTDIENGVAVDLAKAMIADLESRPADWNVHPESAPISELELYPIVSTGRMDMSNFSMKIYERDRNTLRWLEQHGYAVDHDQYVSSAGQDIVAARNETVTAVEYTTESTAPGEGIYQREIAVLRAADRDTLWSGYKELFHFGGYDNWDISESGYDFFEVMLSEEDVRELLSKASSHYISEEPRDVLIVNGQSYLIYPEYSDWMHHQGYTLER